MERERPDLFDQQGALTISVKKDEDALNGVDLSILRRLSSATIGLLDNEELLAAFYEAKVRTNVCSNCKIKIFNSHILKMSSEIVS